MNYQSITVRHTTPAIGAEVLDVDLSVSLGNQQL
jgi:hypothetical protein